MGYIAVVIVLAAGAAVFFMMKKNKAKENTGQAPVEAKTPEPASENEVETIFSNLLNLNILLRKDADLPDETVREIEGIMDDLMVIIPAMIERYPGETLTYEIKKIGKEHLYKTVKEYLDLSLESRNNQMDMFKQTIDNLKQVSNRSRDIVEKNETAEFKTMANFLAGKFS